MVLYFSGTGNSKYIATRIWDSIGGTIISVNDYLKSNKTLEQTEKEALVFVLPTYAWRIPKVVEKWIKESSFIENSPVYFIMNCGGQIADTEKYIIKLCKEKNFDYKGCMEIVMPENYLAMFSTPTKEQGKKIIARAEPIIDLCIKTITEGKAFEPTKATITEKAMSSIVNPLFYTFGVVPGKFKVNNNCISCGKCVKECPLNNIELKDGKPRWHNNCTHCMACITLCPTEAISYGKKSNSRPKYRCPYEL